jgi:hypothetical protein
MFARRNFLFGLTAVCAPAIIRTPNLLMPLGRGLMAAGMLLEMRDTQGKDYLVPMYHGVGALKAEVGRIEMLNMGMICTGRQHYPVSISHLRPLEIGDSLIVSLVGTLPTDSNALT